LRHTTFQVYSNRMCVKVISMIEKVFLKKR
jgi:hypothetical protein